VAGPKYLVKRSAAAAARGNSQAIVF